jgi:excisionase family DNA binding protein
MISGETKRLLLRVSEAAGMLAVSRSKMYELIKEGEIPCVRLGASIRIPTEPLLGWIAQNTSSASTTL